MSNIKQPVTFRQTNLDCGHRVMNEKMKCFNLHGHTYLTKLYFSYDVMDEIGYAIDFKEIKRVFIEYLQEKMDHGMLLNPEDADVIETTKKLGTKLWLMSLNGEGKYCNPSVENIAKEIFIAMMMISNNLYGDSPTKLTIHRVEIYETPNCGVDCYKESVSESEVVNFHNHRHEEIEEFTKRMGTLEYDDRKCDI